MGGEEEKTRNQEARWCQGNIGGETLPLHSLILVSGGGILVRVWYGAGPVRRLRGGLQHEVSTGGAPTPQHHLGAGGRQDGAEDHKTSPGQGLHHVPDLAVLLMDGLGM